LARPAAALAATIGLAETPLLLMPYFDLNL
jgi:hypothetical protein